MTSFPILLHLLIHSRLNLPASRCRSLVTSQPDGSRDTREPKQTPSCQSALYHNITTFTTKLETVVLQPFVQLNRQQCQKNNNKTNHKTVYISWYTIAFFSQQSFTSRQCAANKARDLKTHFLCLHKNTFKKSPKQWSQNPHKQEILKHQHLTVLQKSYILINIFTDLTFIFFTCTVSVAFVIWTPAWFSVQLRLCLHWAVWKWQWHTWMAWKNLKTTRKKSDFSVGRHQNCISANIM